MKKNRIAFKTTSQMHLDRLTVYTRTAICCEYYCILIIHTCALLAASKIYIQFISYLAVIDFKQNAYGPFSRVLFQTIVCNVYIYIYCLPCFDYTRPIKNITSTTVPSKTDNFTKTHQIVRLSWHFKKISSERQCLEK